VHRRCRDRHAGRRVLLRVHARIRRGGGGGSGATRPEQRTGARAHGPAHRRADADGRGVRRRRRPPSSTRDERGARWPGRRLRGDGAPRRRERRADRPRRPSAEGSERRRTPLPARGRGIPAAQNAVPNDAPDRADAACRARTRARGGGCARAFAPSGDAHRARRLGQDEAGGPSRGRRGGAVPRRRFLGSAPGRQGSRNRRAHDRVRRRRRRRAELACRQQAAPAPPRQLRADRRRSADGCRAPRRHAERESPRDEPRAAERRLRAAVPGRAARERGRRAALRRARACGVAGLSRHARGRADLRARRLPPARDRACRGARRAARPGGPLGAARPAPRAPCLALAQRAREAANAPGDDRVELRAARPRRAAALPSTRRLQGHLHDRCSRRCLRWRPRHRRGTRDQEPAAPPLGNAASVHAGHDPRVRVGAARGLAGGGRTCIGSTSSISSSSRGRPT
jgi:hypothetical protein